ncbi:MAG: response regulator transcription factor [Dehalococcoidales bacterium]|jgi:DNA-binding NarL/FixJ family response regulator
MIRVLIADDHAIVRQGLKQIVADYADILIAGEASSGQQVLDMVSKDDYDVVVLDITMPGRSGLEVFKELKGLRPKLPVLILSIHPEEQYAVRVLKAGASGYLTKECAPGELITAIKAISADHKYVTSFLSEKLASQLGLEVAKPPQEALSDREYQIMLLLASGKSVGEIAKEQYLSVKTISTYRHRILTKMKLKSNAELTYYAIQNRLISQDNQH